MSGGVGGVVGIVGASEEGVEVLFGEFPLEGDGDVLVVVLEGEESAFEVGEVGVVVRGENSVTSDGSTNPRHHHWVFAWSLTVEETGSLR